MTAESVDSQGKCPFCEIHPDRQVASNDHAVAVGDNYPLANGHTLIVPRRHVTSLYDLSDEEQAAVWGLVGDVRTELMRALSPHGFNVGLNDGKAAGQTVMHAHVHVIPRRLGDIADPRGGLRWILPDRAKYWDVK